MKKIIALIVSLSLSATLLVGLASCKNDDSKDGKVQYTWDVDSDGVLNKYKVSDAAEDLISEKDYDALAKGFTANNDENKTYDENTVKTVTIPDGVKTVKSGAVSDLSFVEKLVVPSSVEKIESGAFSNLSSLKEIVLPFVGESMGAHNEKKLFGYVFGTASSAALVSCSQTYNDGTSSTATYYIPSTLKTVTVTGEIKTETTDYWYIIDGDKHLVCDENAEGAIKATVVSYDNCAVQGYAFYGCNTLTDVTLNGNVILENTFNGCTTLKNVKINGENIVIGEKAFNGCSAIENVSATDESFDKIAKICESAFANCVSLGKTTDYSVGTLDLSRVSEIETLAFDGCSGMYNLKISESGILANKAFNGCSELRKVLKGSSALDVYENDEIFTDCNDNLYKKTPEGNN